VSLVYESIIGEMNIYYKILSGEISQEEKIDFFNNLESNPQLKKEFQSAKNIWALSKLNDKTVSTIKKKQLFDEMWAKKGSEKSTMKLFRGIMKYAAIIVFAVFLGIAIQYAIHWNRELKNVTTTSYSSSKGSISTVTLADGSTIWLNANSSVEINESKKSVNAKLSGEAYFDIIHNKKREFVVDLGVIKVKDLGTQFNISAYPNDEIIRTSLIDGDIDILDKNNLKVANIDPGERAFYNKNTNKLDIEEFDQSIESAWIDGKFVFIDKSLEQICYELQKWYNIEFKINNAELANTKYTCVLKRTTTIEQILDILKVVSDIRYRIKAGEEENDIVIIDQK
jgi:ferric-dicitrate binding protein FerR (iron transport regulator)